MMRGALAAAAWMALAAGCSADDETVVPAPIAPVGPCSPGEVVSCYSGPEGTDGIGSCRAGQATCGADGRGVGPCEGEVVPALEDCATDEDEDCDGATLPCSSHVSWAKQFGDPDPTGDDDARAWALATDASGNMLLGGYARGSIDFGGGVLDDGGVEGIVVAALDPQGGHRWSRRWASAFGYALAVGAAADGSVWLTGPFTGDVDFGGGPLTGNLFVAKLDPSGDHLHSAGFSFGIPTSLAVTPAGAVVLGGYFNGSIDFGGGEIVTSGSDLDGYVAALDADGAHLWTRQLGGAFDQNVLALALDAAGNVLVAGSYLGAPNFGGGAFPFASEPSGFVVKLDAGGSHVWSRHFAGAVPLALATDPARNVVLTGQLVGSPDLGGGPLPFGGGLDMFVAKLDGDGEHVWSQSAGDGGAQLATSIATDANGAVILGVLTNGKLKFGGETFEGAPSEPAPVVVKLAADGSFLFGVQPAGDVELGRTYVAADARGGVLATGNFSGALDLDGYPLNAGISGHEIFLVRLAQP